MPVNLVLVVVYLLKQELLAKEIQEDLQLLQAMLLKVTQVTFECLWVKVTVVTVATLSYVLVTLLLVLKLVDKSLLLQELVVLNQPPMVVMVVLFLLRQVKRKVLIVMTRVVLFF